MNPRKPVTALVGLSFTLACAAPRPTPPEKTAIYADEIAPGTPRAPLEKLSVAEGQRSGAAEGPEASSDSAKAESTEPNRNVIPSASGGSDGANSGVSSPAGGTPATGSGGAAGSGGASQTQLPLEARSGTKKMVAPR